MKILTLLTAFCLPLLVPCARAIEPVADPISIAISSVSSLTGVSLQIVDLKSTAAAAYYDRDKLAIEVAIETNATAPGASRTVTVYYGFAIYGGYTAAEMATAASNQVLAVANTASVKRVYTLPVVYISGRYLYLWLDHSARDASSALTLTIRVLGVGR